MGGGRKTVQRRCLRFRLVAKIIAGARSVLALRFASPIIVVVTFPAKSYFFDGARGLSCREAGR
jgi:hypothetical protein